MSSVDSTTREPVDVLTLPPEKQFRYMFVKGDWIDDGVVRWEFNGGDFVIVGWSADNESAGDS